MALEQLNFAGLNKVEVAFIMSKFSHKGVEG